MNQKDLEKLRSFCRNGNLQQLNSLLANKGYVHDKKLLTILLQESALHGQLSIAEMLLKQGANVSLRQARVT